MPKKRAKKKKIGNLIKKTRIIRVIKPKEKVIDSLEEEIKEEENENMLEELRDFISPTNSKTVSTGLGQISPIRDLERDLENIPIKRDEEDKEGVSYSQTPEDETQGDYISTGGSDTLSQRSYGSAGATVTQINPNRREEGFQSPEFAMLKNKKKGKDDYSPKQYVDTKAAEREEESKRLPFQKKRDKF